MATAVYRAVGYRRVSMREQVDGHSLEAQTTHIQHYVQAQGWTLLKMYTDAGLSAKKDSDRPALNQLLADARRQQFDVILVDKVDRFYRHLGGLLVALDQLNAYGVTFVSVQEHLDFTTPWGKLMLTMFGTLAEIYIDNLKQETRKGKKQRAREGLWNGNFPFGYCAGLCSHCTDPNGAGYCPNYGQPDHSDGKRLILHPIDHRAVKLAFDCYATGQYSDAAITDLLNSTTVEVDGRQIQLRHRGAPGRTAPGPFMKDSVREMLNRLFYTGQVRYQGVDADGKSHRRSAPAEIYAGQHPVLIEADLFQQVRHLRALFSNNSREKQGKTVRVFPLSGLLRCGYCGAPMRGTSAHNRRYYRDASQIEHTADCQQPLVCADEIEQQVVEYLRSVLTDDAVTQASAAQARLANSEVHFKHVQELYVLGEIDRELYETEKARRENLTQSLTTTKYSATIALHDFSTQLQCWNSSLPIEQKRLLQLSLEGVYIRGNAIAALQPTLAFLPLVGSPTSWNYGPDGIRTRDLGLDRAAC
jgi:site-specific DNA recombinase